MEENPQPIIPQQSQVVTPTAMPQQTVPPPMPSQVPPPVTPTPNIQQPPEMQTKKSSGGPIFAIIILAILILGGAGFYVLNSQKQAPTYAPPLNTTTISPSPIQTQNTEDSVETDSQTIDQELNSLSSASADIDAGLNDQQTNLTP